MTFFKSFIFKWLLRNFIVIYLYENLAPSYYIFYYYYAAVLRLKNDLASSINNALGITFVVNDELEYKVIMSDAVFLVLGWTQGALPRNYNSQFLYGKKK
jgi:hypothetical protein